MSNMLGMDIEGVRRLAQQMQAKGDEIDSIANTLTGMLEGVEWKGQDAEQFRGEWNGALRNMLNQVVQALRDASQKANNNANQQEQTSAS